MNSWARQQVTKIVSAGGVIACPTEAVWGLSCDPFNKQAVDKVRKLKQRKKDKGFILVAETPFQFAALIKHLTVEQQKEILASWPGANTWLVPHHNLIPEWISGDSDKVALRVTAHPLLSRLCSELGPLLSTSANISGTTAAKNLLKARCYFKNNVDYYCSGQTLANKTPSVIKDICSGKTIRA